MKDKLVTKHIVNVGVSALARELGVSAATISMRMKRGQTIDQIRADFRHKTHKKGGQGIGKPPTGGEYDMVVASRTRYEQLEDAKLRRAKALAERQEIENMLRRGELMPITYARQWGIRFLMDGRDEMLKGPSELADQLAAETDPLKVQAILRAWMERVIAKFEQLEMLWKDVEKEQVA